MNLRSTSSHRTHPGSDAPKLDSLLANSFGVRDWTARSRKLSELSVGRFLHLSALRPPPSAFRRPPSTFRLPPSALHLPPSTFRPPPSAFTLLELLVVVGIISLLVVAVIPAVTSLSKSSGSKSAVSGLMNSLDQARALALTSGAATYVVFADQTTPENYRCRAYIVFQEKNFVPTAVTKWNFLPTGISFLPSQGLLTPQTTVEFLCPGTVSANPVRLPFIKFDSNGMVAAPTVAAGLFVNFFSGFVDQGGTPTYTDKKQETAQRFDQIKVAPFTGSAQYVNPYPTS